MSTSADHEPIEELIENAVQRERRRCVGMTLAALGVCRLSGRADAARMLDALATKMEQEDGWGGEDRS
jgi:hypothetical protein